MNNVHFISLKEIGFICMVTELNNDHWVAKKCIIHMKTVGIAHFRSTAHSERWFFLHIHSQFLIANESILLIVLKCSPEQRCIWIQGCVCVCLRTHCFGYRQASCVQIELSQAGKTCTYKQPSSTFSGHCQHGCA